jgi:hypothetical protein
MRQFRSRFSKEAQLDRRDLKLREHRAKNKASHLGVPLAFELELACQHINRAFDGFGCYLVGSATYRSDWRDIDIVYIMDDKAFDLMFPNAGHTWEHDARWLVLNIAMSKYLGAVAGHTVDFKFQRQTDANKLHRGSRHAIGLRFSEKSE